MPPGTDRKNKPLKEAKSAVNDQSLALAAFTLPDSLPCSEIEFPILVRKGPKANWNQILKESHETHKELEEYVQRKQEVPLKSPFQRTQCNYIQNEVFVYLIPALEETLNKAKIWDAFARHKCFFNGIDHIVQLLWNNNPRYPARLMDNHHIFNMPWVRKCLAENPRPYYPKSWLWPEDYAATIIQKTVRQYFVQREEEVQEMRDFWRKLELEKQIPEMNTNPFLAKRFASEPSFKKT